jgi:hypothetical protein
MPLKGKVDYWHVATLDGRAAQIRRSRWRPSSAMRNWAARIVLP